MYKAFTEQITEMDDETPVRSYMDDPNIKWKTTKPDFTLVNKKYLAEKTKCHPVGSLEKLVENLVKTWEMESTHKVDAKDWKTVDASKYNFRTNMGPKRDLAYNIERGNYNMMLEDCPLFDVTKETNDSALDLFHQTFPEGFAWELLEVLSGPPKVSFTWRHWANWTGAFRNNPPTGEKMEMFGVGVAEVNDELKIVDLQVYFDPNPLIGKLLGHDAAKCPFSSA